ncbi:WD40 repeat domain-containing protein [Micromonospora sp. WMMD558]|uniref:WD40 repeat domain-containing protein n=1 Tax=Micromonospora sp. WMMD558 TaxID=3403462 RepID=UPI003BF594AA
MVGRQVGHAANPDTESAESPTISLRAPNHIPQHWKNEHTSTVTAMIFTDDATTLVTGSSDSTIRFPTGMGLAARPPLTSSRLDSIDALALPDGTTNRIVAADIYSVELWTTS